MYRRVLVSSRTADLPLPNPSAGTCRCSVRARGRGGRRDAPRSPLREARGDSRPVWTEQPGIHGQAAAPVRRSWLPPRRGSSRVIPHRRVTYAPPQALSLRNKAPDARDARLDSGHFSGRMGVELSALARAAGIGGRCGPSRVGACSQRVPVGSATPSAAPSGHELLRFERTGCFGQCPALSSCFSRTAAFGTKEVSPWRSLAPPKCESLVPRWQRSDRAFSAFQGCIPIAATATGGSTLQGARPDFSLVFGDRFPA